MSRKECELCSNPARMFCYSDQASLCWDCDEKVHAANFLVAKHSRTLLCHLCHSPTPWKAAGPRLGATISVCHACSRRHDQTAASSASARNGEADADSDGDYYTDDSSGEEEDEDEDEVDEDGENQVVPWSASSCNEEEEEEDNVSSKRTRDDAFASSEDEDGCCSSRDAETSNEESDENYCSSSSSRFLRALKMSRGLIPPEPAAEPSMGTAAIVEKLRRFEQEESDASEMIIGLCDLARD